MALAKKTDSILIYSIAWFSFGILCIYIVHHINSWHFEAFHSFTNSRLAWWAGLIVWVIIVMVLVCGTEYVLMTAIDAIVQSNTK